MKFKLGFGPMSDIIVDTLASYARDQKRPLMIIASRNQVDANSGYVMTTDALVKRIQPSKSEYLRVCRDHCGPYFLDSEKGLSIDQAIEATKRTIAADIEAGFDLIHIDTSRCEDQYHVADQLLKFCIDLNPSVRFEFGTEENVGVAAGKIKYKKDVDFAKNYPNMDFVVAQTGSLTMEDRQVGSFDVEAVKELVEYANQAKVGLKEHNADYLTADQIALRRSVGVHALNIAPQLGVVQTKTVLALAEQQGIDSSLFKQTVLDSRKWSKWILDGNDDVKIAVAGHYCYNTKSYQDLVKNLDVVPVVTDAIKKVLDTYYDSIF
jgi:tagatose-1,6-bisphosphate aldolase non-catalytic subunit AgaZ/GatZ